VRVRFPSDIHTFVAIAILSAFWLTLTMRGRAFPAIGKFLATGNDACRSVRLSGNVLNNAGIPVQADSR
jgi:hypothetical protein